MLVGRFSISLILGWFSKLFGRKLLPHRLLSMLMRGVSFAEFANWNFMAFPVSTISPVLPCTCPSLSSDTTIFWLSNGPPYLTKAFFHIVNVHPCFQREHPKARSFSVTLPFRTKGRIYRPLIVSVPPFSRPPFFLRQSAFTFIRFDGCNQILCKFNDTRHKSIDKFCVGCLLFGNYI